LLDIAPEVRILRYELYLLSFSIQHRDGRMFLVPIETVKSLDHDLLLILGGEKRFRIPWWLCVVSTPLFAVPRVGTADGRTYHRYGSSR
jgi:hypothetical protein